MSGGTRVKTVGELRAFLKRFPDNAEVVLWDDGAAENDPADGEAHDMLAHEAHGHAHFAIDWSGK